MPQTQILSVPTATPTIPPLPAGATYATGADGKVYVKYATQDAKTGQWVQNVQQVVNGVLVPVLQVLFPNGVTPNNGAGTTLPNGQVLGNFQPVQTGSGVTTGNNTLLFAGIGVAAVALLMKNNKNN